MPKGRWIQLKGGKISSGKGIHENPDFTIFFKNKKIAASFLTPPFDQLERIDAAKNFKLTMTGPDDMVVWFMALVASMESYTWATGTDMGDGVMRYTNGTNGGACGDRREQNRPGRGFLRPAHANAGPGVQG